MSGAALPIAVAVCLAMAFLWAVMPPLATLLLKAARALEISAEQAPTAHAALVELAHVAGIPRPRLYVAPGPHPTGAALQTTPRGVVAVSEAAFDVLSEAELRGLLALLVAGLAVGASRQRVPWRERWFVIDRLATTLIGPQTVVAALSALMCCEPKVAASSDMPFTGCIWSTGVRLKGGVATVFSREPSMVARVGFLTPKADSEAATYRAPSPGAPTGR